MSLLVYNCVSTDIICKEEIRNLETMGEGRLDVHFGLSHELVSKWDHGPLGPIAQPALLHLRLLKDLNEITMAKPSQVVSKENNVDIEEDGPDTHSHSEDDPLSHISSGSLEDESVIAQQMSHRNDPHVSPSSTSSIAADELTPMQPQGVNETSSTAVATADLDGSNDSMSMLTPHSPNQSPESLSRSTPRSAPREGVSMASSVALPSPADAATPNDGCHQLNSRQTEDTGGISSSKSVKGNPTPKVTVDEWMDGFVAVIAGPTPFVQRARASDR